MLYGKTATKTFAEDVTLEEVVASSEIAVSKFDEVTGNLEQPFG